MVEIEHRISGSDGQARRIEVTDLSQVLDKTKHNRLGRFPEAASEDLLAGPKRNFQVKRSSAIADCGKSKPPARRRVRRPSRAEISSVDWGQF